MLKVSTPFKALDKQVLPCLMGGQVKKEIGPAFLPLPNLYDRFLTPAILSTSNTKGSQMVCSLFS